MRVLFADDEAQFLTPLLKRLARRSIEAVGVGSGEEALKLMDSQGSGPGFDVVVLDIKMPGIGGLATLSELQARHPQTPVILLTAHTDLEDAIACLEDGAFCHLMKPVDLDTLIWRITDAFDQKKLQENSVGTAAGSNVKNEQD